MPALLVRHVSALALGLLSALAAAQGASPAATAEAPAASAPATVEKQRAIFAVSDSDPQKWNLTLANIANALDGIGKDKADFELVVYGPAIAMLKKDSPVADKVAAAVASGVHVVGCRNSMRGAHLEEADLVQGVDTVASGVVELIRRQLSGYAYVRS